MIWNSIWNFRNTLPISFLLIYHVIFVLVIDVFQVVCHFLLARHQDPSIVKLCCFLGELGHATYLENISLVCFLKIVIADIRIHLFFSVLDTTSLVLHNLFILLWVTTTSILTTQAIITVLLFEVHVTFVDVSGKAFIWFFISSKFAFTRHFRKVSLISWILWSCWRVWQHQIEFLRKHLIRLIAELVLSWPQLGFVLCIVIILSISSWWNL